MNIQELEAFARDLIYHQPTTPRHFPLRILAHAVLSKEYLFLGFFGLLVLFAGVYNVIRPADDPTLQFIVAGVAFTCGGFMCFGVLIGAYFWYVALRFGRVATARVTELGDQGFGSTSPLNPRVPGLVEGRWIINVPGASFSKAFLLYRPWASRLYVGAQITVLVHPTRSKVLAELGP